MGKQAAIKQSIKLFEDFSGHSPQYIDKVSLPVHPVAMAIGHLSGVMYETVRDGKREKYIHQFKKGCRPVLAVSPDGKQLYILAGEYKFTDAGIKDGAN